MRKTWRGGGESLLENGTIDYYVTKHVIPVPDLYCTGRWHLGDFGNIFPLNTGWAKKMLPLFIF